MIQPILNELSFTPLCQSKDEVEYRVDTFVELLRELRNLGVKSVRTEYYLATIFLTEHQTLADYFNENSKNSKLRTQNDFLYAMLRRPYIDEIEEHKVYEYKNAYFVTDDEKEFDALGLLVAYLTKSFVVGFDAGLFKGDRHKSCSLKLVKTKPMGNNENDEIITAKVCCLTHKNQMYALNEFIQLMSSQNDLVVPVCKGKNESFHLPAHHGQSECEEFAKRLLRCEYVQKIVNSIDFDSRESDFIHRIKDYNQLEIRLLHTKMGYGLCIETSAENIIQNHWIAKHLTKKYGN